MDSKIIQRKLICAEKQLESVDQEISEAISFLINLRHHSAEKVNKLREITSLPLFLQEYVQANTFLLKYSSFLTEINCKFELFQDVENGSLPPPEILEKKAIVDSSIDNEIVLTDLHNLLNCEVTNDLSENKDEHISNVQDNTSNVSSSSDVATTSENISNHIIVQPFPLKIEEGDKLEVKVTHIRSPSEFYVHIESDELKNLEHLNELLKILPKPHQNNNFKELSMKEMRSYALYYSITEETWYRVEIIDWCLHRKDNYVVIFLLDYGVSIFENLNLLIPFPEFFQKFPAFAVKCHLYGICSESRSDDVSKWDEEVAQQMKLYFDDTMKLTIKIGPKDTDYDDVSLPVILRVEGKEDSLNDFLLKSQYVEIVTENEQLSNWNPMKEDFESPKNTYGLNLKDPAASIYGYVGKDYQNVCLHFAKKGKCFKGAACRKKHITLDPLGYTRDEEEMFQHAFNSLAVPSVNDKINVRVTYVSKFNEFFCHIENTAQSANEEDINLLSKFLNTEHNKAVMQKLVVPPTMGQIVLAQFTGDDYWYRARVLDNDSEADAYTVLFVDYGNTETLPLQRIRKIEPRYLHLPFQAMKCTIHGIRKNPYLIHSFAEDYLNERLSDSFITIEVVSILPEKNISLLVKVYDKEGKNIGDDLLSKNYALVKEDFVHLNGVESLPG